MKRRAFLQKLGTGAAAAAVSYPGKSTHAAVRIRWRMVMSWPLHFPILGESMDRLAADVASMSKGRFTIKVFGGGELVPPLGVFDAVSAGTVQMGNGAAYYWSGKAPAAAFFTNVPIGMNAQQTNAWLSPAADWTFGASCTRPIASSLSPWGTRASRWAAGSVNPSMASMKRMQARRRFMRRIPILRIEL